MSTSRLFERRTFSLTDPDVKATITPRVGERWQVNVDVADRAMPQLADVAIQDALRRVAYDLSPLVLQRASDILMGKCDRDWVRNVVESELRFSVREFVKSLFTSTPEGDRRP